MASKKHYGSVSADDLTDKEIEIAQWRVDVTESGRWKIDEIYGEFWAGQDQKQLFGKKFKAAVEGGRIKRITALKHANGDARLSSDHQQLYDTIKLSE